MTDTLKWAIGLAIGEAIVGVLAWRGVGKGYPHAHAVFRGYERRRRRAAGFIFFGLSAATAVYAVLMILGLA